MDTKKSKNNRRAKTSLQKAHSSHTSTEGSGASKMLFAILFGIIGGFIIGLIFVLIFSAVLLSFSDPAVFIDKAAVLAFLLSSFFSGLLSVKRSGGNPLIYGIICGIGVSFLLSLPSLFIATENHFSFFVSILIRIVGILLAIFGGFLAKYRPSTRKKRHRR